MVCKYYHSKYSNTERKYISYNVTRSTSKFWFYLRTTNFNQLRRQSCKFLLYLAFSSASGNSQPEIEQENAIGKKKKNKNTQI